MQRDKPDRDERQPHGAKEPAIPSVTCTCSSVYYHDALLTPHLLSRRPTYWVKRAEPKRGCQQKMPDSITRYLTAGLCGLETSMEDFDFLLSSAVTT